MTTKFIHKRRELIEEPRDMYAYQAELLNAPGGRRELAKRVTDIRFNTDPAKSEGLCKDLADTLYKDQLYEIALKLDLPVTKRLTKAELCKMISKYAEEANLPEPEQSSPDEEKFLKVVPVRMIYDAAYQKYGEDLYSHKIVDLAREFGNKAFPIEYAKIAVSPIMTTGFSEGSNIFRNRMWNEGPEDWYDHEDDENYILPLATLGDIYESLDEDEFSLPSIQEVLDLNILHPDQVPNFLSLVRFMYDNRVWEDNHLAEREQSGWFTTVI